MLNTPITPPRVPLIDPRTNLIDRAWYMFFLSLNNAATAIIDNPDLGPSFESLIASYDAALQTLTQDVGTQPPTVDSTGELIKQINAATLANQSSALLSQIAEMQKQIQALNLAPMPLLGTVTAVTATAPVVSSGGIAPNVSMPVANTATNGYLSSTDWNTFNNKQSVSAPVIKTADFTIATTDLWLINNKSGSTCTATLPTASSFSGRILHFQNYQAQALISASSNVVPLAGGAAGTSILLASTGDSATLVSDGSNWLMTQYAPNNILLLE